MTSIMLCLQQTDKSINMTSLNSAPRYRDKNQSSFRVHFYLKNVYYNNEYKLSTFLQETAARINKVVEVSILQIYGSVRKMVDLSVGLKSDSQASIFMQSNKKISLLGEYGKLVEHQPIYSDLFKTYVKYNQSKQPSAINTNLVDQKNQELNEQINSPVAAQNKKKYNEDDSIPKKVQAENPKHFAIFIFGIPLEYKQRDIMSLLSEKGFRTKYYEWKYKEDMQFLLLQLHQPITQKEISALDIRLQRYPLLVMPKVHEEFINTIIMKLQVQLNFQKNIDEVELMKRADQVGGVILMIKDEFYGPRKYNITYNTISNLIKFQQSIESHYKTCQISKPRYIVRLCRLEKNFTFTQMIENLHYYESQLKRMKAVSPESSLF